MRRLLRKVLSEILRVLKRIVHDHPDQEPGKLSSEALVIFSEMKQDNALAGSPFAPQEAWKIAEGSYEEAFQKEGIQNPETSRYNLGYAGFAPGDPRLHYFFMYQLYALLKQIDTYGLLKKIPAHVPAIKGDMLTSYKGLGLEIEGNVLSTDVLLSIATVYVLYEADHRILTDHVVVADLGAGWGRIGYVLKMANPKVSYHVFDIPQALLVSSTYLPSLLPGNKVSDYRSGAKKNVISREYLLQYGLGFWGSQKFADIDSGALDFFINIASFMEMPRTQVKEYLALVDNKLRGICYLLQLRERQTHGLPESIIGGLSEYDFPPHWEELFIRNSIFSNTYFESCHRVVAQKDQPHK